MTKADVARQVAAALGCTAAEGERLVQVVFDVLAEGLVKESGVRIPSFGVFSVFRRGARKIREVNTGEERVLRPRPQVSFRAAARLKDQIRTC